jgi:aspartyl/asparaginyl beta-hydroxylase (cupin superfamily)
MALSLAFTVATTSCPWVCSRANVNSAKALCWRRLSSPHWSATWRVDVTCALSFGDMLERELASRYGESGSRVLYSFRSARAGVSLETGIGTPRHRRAHSFIEDLDAKPFHDTAEFPWVKYLEDNWVTIADELKRVEGDPVTLEKGTNVWVAAARQEATSYGPDWRTLVLQDRTWDPMNAKLFPQTTALLRNADVAPVPSVEAFFARQAPDTGITLHTDDCNFILTMHLSLDVPDNESWIEVGGERRYWENSKALVFDTSFYHQTMNESKTKTRTVLLIRFWHPMLSVAERDAVSFLFSAIEDPSLVENEDERGTVSALSAASVKDRQCAADSNAANTGQLDSARSQRRKAQHKARKRARPTITGLGGGGFAK